MSPRNEPGYRAELLTCTLLALLDNHGELPLQQAAAVVALVALEKGLVPLVASGAADYRSAWLAFRQALRDTPQVMVRIPDRQPGQPVQEQLEGLAIPAAEQDRLRHRPLYRVAARLATWLPLTNLTRLRLTLAVAWELAEGREARLPELAALAALPLPLIEQMADNLRQRCGTKAC